MKRATAILMLVMVAVASRSAVDFSRYAPILERRPFSSPVAAEPENANAAVTVDTPPAFVQHLRMVAITESPAGVRVGFVNIREKPPKTYFLFVGDSSEDGILLAEADYDRERALLRKDGEQYWLSMGEAASASTPTPVAGAARVDGRPRIRPARPPSENEDDARKRAMSYAERRRQRIEEMRKRAQESRNLSEEEVEKRLREYQMKLIREGKTPLPIPITEEMDAQLVKEGILPPRE
jgi:hypothetical protein